MVAWYDIIASAGIEGGSDDKDDNQDEHDDEDEHER